jgi:hypothetical protein
MANNRWRFAALTPSATGIKTGDTLGAGLQARVDEVRVVAEW